MSDYLLQAEGIRKSYRVGRRKIDVLKGVDVAVRSGEVIAVMGPSGSGKTTLLNCVAGLDSVDDGRVRLIGCNVHAISAEQRAKMRRFSIGFLFQDYNLVPFLTVADNMRLPFKLDRRRVKTSEIHGMLDLLGMAHRARFLPDKLSGGERQRVAIARMLLTNPQFIFADEPTGALDRASWQTAMKLITEHARRPDHAGLVVTHDPSVAALCDRVIVLTDGQVSKELIHPDAREVAAILARHER